MTIRKGVKEAELSRGRSVLAAIVTKPSIDLVMCPGQSMSFKIVPN